MTDDNLRLSTQPAPSVENNAWIESSENEPVTIDSLRPRVNVNKVLRWYFATDVIALFASFIFSWAIAATVSELFLNRPFQSPLSFASPLRLIEFALIGVATLLWFHHTNHYRMRMPFWTEVKKVCAVLALAMMADGFLQFATKQSLSRSWLMASWLVAAVAIILLRNVVRAYLQKRGHFQMHTLLIGAGATAQHTRDAVTSEPALGCTIVAQIKDLPEAFLRAGKSWETLCAMHGADYLIIALDGKELASAEQSMAQLVRESVPFSISPPLRHLPVTGMTPQYFFNHDIMLLVRSSGLEQPFHCSVKRALDIFLAGSALLALSPIMLVLTLLARRDGGPAFFGHARLGRDGKTFHCYKFRSMVMNGDAVLQDHLARNPVALQEWNATRKLVNDPRVTKLGDFLRRSSLDELPQLWNVVRGDMSLVGPRPIVTAEVANYEGDIAHYYRVRPGITGLWQVSGRSDVSYPQRVHMDSWYVRNWSLWHDIAIICKTFPALLKRSGAY